MSWADCRICLMLVVRPSKAGTAAARPSPPSAPPTRRWCGLHEALLVVRRPLGPRPSGAWTTPSRRCSAAEEEETWIRGSRPQSRSKTMWIHQSIDPGHGGGEVWAKGPAAKGGSDGCGSLRRERRREIGAGSGRERGAGGVEAMESGQESGSGERGCGHCES